MGRKFSFLVSLYVLCLMTMIFLFVGCTPKTFIRTAEPGWNTIEIREDLKYEDAWKTVVDILARKFDLEVLSKDDGYLRTGWLFSWTGEMSEAYKVRAMIKFSQDKHKVEVKSEAQHFTRGFLGMGAGWEMGTDELLGTTLRTDIMGKVGRITR
jgi:hypothetical protein